MPIRPPHSHRARLVARVLRPRGFGRRDLKWLDFQDADKPNGGKCGLLLVAIVMLFGVSPVRALEISVRQISPDSFQLVLTNGATMGEREAQAYVAKAAASICKERTPVLGKYSFNSKEVLGGNSLTQAADTFQFTQSVSCAPVVLAAPNVIASPNPIPVDEQKVREEIISRTERYFRLLSDNRIDDAYTEMSRTRKAWDEADWKRDKRAFQSEAGKPQSVAIIKITLYKNPTEAPEPGLYVAADYSNVYKNVPIQCGYLMWFRTPSGEFEITREEMGFVTAEQLKRIPAEQLPELKQRLRCVAP